MQYAGTVSDKYQNQEEKTLAFDILCAPGFNNCKRPARTETSKHYELKYAEFQFLSPVETFSF